MSAKILKFPVSPEALARLKAAGSGAQWIETKPKSVSAPPAKSPAKSPAKPAIQFDPDDERFEGQDPTLPEYESVDEFAEFLADDDRTTFTHADLACLNARTNIRTADLKKALEEYGLTQARRRVEREVRGFSANSHDRWHGKGSCPTHGGGGGGSIVGMAWETENG